MSKFESIDGEAFFDSDVEVSFEKTLDSQDTIQVLHIVLDIIQKAVRGGLVDGIAALAIQQETLGIRFRYSKVRNIKSELPEMGIEDLSRLRAQLVFYLFAKVDSLFPLRNDLFPENFRYFLNFPDDLKKFYGIDIPL